MTRKIFLAVNILFLGAAALAGAPAKRWIHVRVEGATGASHNMTLNVPIEMASAVLPAIPADGQRHGKFSLQTSVDGMDVRALLDAVRNSPDNASVTMQRNGMDISVVKSGRDLLIKIVEKPSAEHHLGKTIGIKVPISVVRAMLAKNSDEVDISAGIHALALEGDLDVTVNSEKETVRVWTDTSTMSD